MSDIIGRLKDARYSYSMTGLRKTAFDAMGEIESFRDQLQAMQAERDEALARVAELRNLCERLQHCAQGFYVDQGDYGHMEAIMHDYFCIMKASKPWRDAYVKRLQAEAVEAAAKECMPGPCGPPDDPPAGYQEFCEGVASVRDYAQRLRQQADDVEKAGGDQ